MVPVVFNADRAEEFMTCLVQGRAVTAKDGHEVITLAAACMAVARSNAMKMVELADRIVGVEGGNHRCDMERGICVVNTALDLNLTLCFMLHTAKTFDVVFDRKVVAVLEERRPLAIRSLRGIKQDGFLKDTAARLAEECDKLPDGPEKRGIEWKIALIDGVRKTPFGPMPDWIAKKIPANPSNVFVSVLPDLIPLLQWKEKRP